ncbi:MAG TPA: CPBP family intramembrane glutamic endopeptidase [Candidatus Acidoferrales bacterium]|nr:CPBP family intramembrane glutamic endopeptidase [Candidatus Acidoferrales bacterium]
MTHGTPIDIAVLAVELIPALVFAFAAERSAQAIAKWAVALRIAAPAALVVPYAILAAAHHSLRWDWLLAYTVLPVVMAWLLERAALVDPEQRGNWRDALILFVLGLAVDLRWFDAAWPEGLRGLGNLLLVDAGLYAFLGIRRLNGTGFDFHLRWNDWKTGFRELLFFAPIVVGLGIALGFIHPHTDTPRVSAALLRWIGIFVFVAVPEELFFRAWVQNLLERRIGRRGALITASALFGLSHFNKRNLVGQHFNWHYVLLATIAGIFYGRAWREKRRVPASTITHTCVDWLWSWWF